MRTSRTLSSPYSPLSFHVVRAFSFISTVIVAAIMIYFAYHLHQDGFKLPFTFIVIMATCFLTFLNLAFTTALYLCGNLSPTLSLVLNTILLLLWIVSLGLLSWSTTGTLTTTCDTSSWGTDTGVMVCRLYKTLFSFIVIGFVAHIAAIAVDSIARRNQRERGNYYDAMASDNMLTDFKLDQRSSQTSGVVSSSTSNPNDPTTDAYNAFGRVRPHEQQQQQRYAHSQTTTGYSGYSNHPYQYDHDVLEQHHAGEAQEFYDNVPAVSGAWSGRRNDAVPQYSPLNSHGYGYGAPTGQTHYDPGNYR